MFCSLFDSDGRRQHQVATAWAKLIVKTLACPTKVTGLDHLNDGKPRVYAASHGSALDIPLLFAYLPFRFRIVFKRELQSVPFLGWYLTRSRQPSIDYDSPVASVSGIRWALRSLRAGIPLVIFPEGGRTPHGRLQPLLPGAFFFALKAQVEVVPIAILGTHALLPINSHRIRPCAVEIRAGQPISTVGRSTKDITSLRDEVAAAIACLAS